MAIDSLYQETIYFNESVKGDQLFISSKIISHRGTVINTNDVSQFTKITFKQSVNGIPSAATFRIIVASPDGKVAINFARFGGTFWLGNRQFERVGSALYEAAGKRLFSGALARLRNGETLIWRHNPSSFEKDSTVKLSRFGISIQQTGVIFNKDISIEWPSLKFSQVNGSTTLQNYKTKQKVTIKTWHMIDNMTFLNVIGFLVDKANYRLLI